MATCRAETIAIADGVLVGAAGMSYEEAAEIAHCAVGTVKSRVNRARSKLTSLLGIDSDDAFGPDLATTAVVGKTDGLP